MVVQQQCVDTLRFLVGSFAIAFLCDTFVSDKKAFGGDCPLTECLCNLFSVSKAALFFCKQVAFPKTVSEKEWWLATDTKFQAWPRTAGPPVIMNPISRPELHRQNPLNRRYCEKLVQLLVSIMELKFIF